MFLFVLGFFIQLSLWIMFLSIICLLSHLLLSLKCFVISIVCCCTSSAESCLCLMGYNGRV